MVVAFCDEHQQNLLNEVCTLFAVRFLRKCEGVIQGSLGAGFAAWAPSFFPLCNFSSRRSRRRVQHLIICKGMETEKKWGPREEEQQNG